MRDENLCTRRRCFAGRSIETSIWRLAGLVMLAGVGVGIAGCDAGRVTPSRQESGQGAAASPGDKGKSQNSSASGTSEARKNAGSPGADSIARGQLLLAQYQCGSCHAIPEVPASRRFNGPTLEAFGKRSYIAGHLPNHSDTLALWIMSPQSLVPDTPMPDMGASLADARDMAAYLGALQ